MTVIGYSFAYRSIVYYIVQSSFIQLGEGKVLDRMPFRSGFSFSIRRMALSMAVPTSGVCAASATTAQRASCSTTKKNFCGINADVIAPIPKYLDSYVSR